MESTKRFAWLWLLSTALLCLVLCLSCGDDDDDDDDDDNDDNDDDASDPGTCEDYCEKVISCGDPSWSSVDQCATSCEGSPNRDCMLQCDSEMICGDWFDCLAAC